ncbi:MAG: preprotein translocase subunit YajC [Verrucomicrobiae bacterium]|nr:preprotein translocase subunit YajC [Verrucomicrobiae bacterium]
MHLNCFSGLLAFAPAPAGSTTGSPQGSMAGMLIPLVLMGVIFYFLLLRPQQQRAKQQTKMLKALKGGDRVVTSAGIVGVVVSLKDTTVTLRSGDAKFEVTKGSIAEVIPSESTTPTAS